MENESSKAASRRVLEGMSKDAKFVLAEVLRIEQSHIYKSSPYGIVPELQSAVERVIK